MPPIVDPFVNLDPSGGFVNLGAQFSTSPRGVACSADGQVVYVVDSGDDSIYRSDNFGGSFTNLGAQFSTTPCGVACSADGQVVYVVDSGDDSIYRSDNFGGSFTNLGAQFSTTPEAVACSADGQVVYVVDSGDDSIYRSGDSGVSFTNLGAQFSTSLRGVACSADGQVVYVVDSGDVSAYRSDNFGGSFTNLGAQFNVFPAAVACSVDGQVVYVVDRGDDSIYRLVRDPLPQPPQVELPDFVGVPFAADVFLFQTLDDGDIELNDGVVGMTSSFRTAVYLSMFGGNGWWGNIDEVQPERQYTAKTQTLLETLPPASRNLLLIEEAAKSDLSWFISEDVASSVEAVATIPSVNQVKLVISTIAEGQESDFEFTEIWKSST